MHDAKIIAGIGAFFCACFLVSYGLTRLMEALLPSGAALQGVAWWRWPLGLGVALVNLAVLLFAMYVAVRVLINVGRSIF